MAQHNYLVGQQKATVAIIQEDNDSRVDNCFNQTIFAIMRTDAHARHEPSARSFLLCYGSYKSKVTCASKA
ncbi:hypothetical protein EBZ39_15190 [bacterium]|nr:hypothetical protein [bacterium]